MRKIRVGLVLWGMMGVLFACERDSKEGDMVVVDFSVGSAEYEEFRGFGTGEVGEAGEMGQVVESEEITEAEATVSLNDDYYLKMTLRADKGALRADERALRAATISDLVDGQKVCIETFKLDGTPVGSVVNYVYSEEDGDLKSVGNPVMVEPGATYRFVVYSYYNNVPDEFPAVTGIDPNERDLVYAVVEKAIKTDDRTVAIVLKHLASRVRVKVSTSRIAGSEIGSMGAVSILGGRTAGLTGSGFAATGTAILYDDIAMTGSGDVRVSGYFPFYPSPTGVSISSIAIEVGGSAVYTNNVGFLAPFTRVLEGGKYYTLTVDFEKFKSGDWAYSNIYWDGQGMTFDKSEVSAYNVNNKEFQGVYFKWGSLVGLPALMGGVEQTSNMVIYIPDPATGMWDGTKKANTAHGLWANSGVWGSIPRSKITTPTNMTTNVLYINPDFDNYIGDICSFLTGGSWRMPTMNEFGSSGNYGSFISGTPAGLNTEGTGSIPAGRTYTAGSVFFPASGYRETDGQALMTTIGVSGAYWSGSIPSTSNAHYLNFSSSGVNVSSSTYVVRTAGCSVRCVKN